ncbi:hypothetical protein LXL04_007245 [Taraxacum kok-saghyz]
MRQPNRHLKIRDSSSKYYQDGHETPLKSEITIPIVSFLRRLGFRTSSRLLPPSPKSRLLPAPAAVLPSSAPPLFFLLLPCAVVAPSSPLRRRPTALYILIEIESETAIAIGTDEHIMNTIDPGPDSLQQSENAYLTTSKFDSYDDLVKSVREFYYTKGYGISIRGSNLDKYVILQCDRGGSYRAILGISGKRKKSTSTRLINCPFQIVGKKQGHDGAWMIKIKDLSHNHEPSEDISGHPSFRQLPSECVKTVEEMTNAGIPPRQILSSLRQQTPNLPAISRTI